MMERLTERDKDGNAYWRGINGVSYSDKYGNIYGNAITKLAEYEDLEEQGLLLRLPCKVGDTVYRIGEYKIYEPSKESEQREWVLVREECKIYEQPFSLYDLRLIGKTVFLTREEAEAKLKELKEMEGNA